MTMTMGANQRRGTGARASSGLTSLGLGLALTVLAACTLPADRVDTAHQDAEQFFSIGYQDIADVFIDDVPTADLAFAGLEGLATLEPELTVEREPRHLTLQLASAAVGRYPLPEDYDVDGWARTTASAIDDLRLSSSGIGEASQEEIYESIFDGLVTELDRFSRYAGRDEARENRASRVGFGGIGVRIRLVENGIKVMQVFADSPAARSGLMEADVIVAIEGEPTKGLSQRDAVKRLRGPIDSRVNLTLERPSLPTPVAAQVTRALIVPETVTGRLDDDIGVIKIASFNRSTTRTLRETLRELQRAGGQRLKGYVLDLRSNPGGLLDQSVSVADIFVTRGRLVSTHGRHPDSHQYFNAEPDDLAKGLPIVVLINRGSASAAEIVAAALQDSGRAVVIGSSSFGKGSVQTVLRMPNDGELLITWARFHAPSGYALDRRGVLPDICTSGDELDNRRLEADLKGGNLPVQRSLRGRQIDPRDEAAVEAFAAHCPRADGDNAGDLVLAKRLLSDPSLYALAREAPPETAQTAPDQVSERLLQ